MAFATAQASGPVSLVITCSLIPNRMSRPSASARPRIQASLSATWAGGSPQVRYVSTYLAATGPAAGDEPPKYTPGTGSGGFMTVAPSTW